MPRATATPPIFIRTSNSTFSNCLVTKVERGSTCTWRSGYCYLNKGECNLNQSKDDSFVERVAKNNREQ